MFSQSKMYDLRRVACGKKIEDEPIPTYEQDGRSFKLLLNFHIYYGYEPYGTDDSIIEAAWDSINKCFFEKRTGLQVRDDDICMWWKED